uniref:Ras-GAP domain-containing protein n=1 Tax=Heterorhabditis bacteriophora TaxID=37862 RepID=A0A1I7WCG5_HETBA
MTGDSKRTRHRYISVIAQLHFLLKFRNTKIIKTLRTLLKSFHYIPSRTTNGVEGSDTRIRATFPSKLCFILAKILINVRLTANSPDEQVPYILDMLKYCCGEMTIAKSLTASIANGTLVSRYIRPDELQRQEEIYNNIRDLQQFLIQLNRSLPTARNIKSFLDHVPHQMAQCC